VSSVLSNFNVQLQRADRSGVFSSLDGFVMTVNQVGSAAEAAAVAMATWEAEPGVHRVLVYDDEAGTAPLPFHPDAG
jgi:hypothetical protein